MVGHDLHLDDVEAHLVRHLQRYLLETPVHAVHQHRPAALRAEDHVVPAAADYVVVALAFHAGIIPLADSYRLTAMRGLTPCLKEGACVALLVIGGILLTIVVTMLSLAVETAQHVPTRPRSES